MTPTQTIDYDRTYELWEDKLSSDQLGQVYDNIGWNTWRGMIRKDLLYCLQTFNLKTVLDVGCFRGDYLQCLLDQKNPFVYEGIDCTPSYIQAARRKFSRVPSTPTRQFGFSLGNIFQLDYPDHSWDLAFCTGVLLHLPELDRPLKELFRVTDKYLLLGVDVHPQNYPDETTTVKNGFLYKTWSEPYIFGQIKLYGNIVHVSRFPSPDYPYHHYSIIASPTRLPQPLIDFRF